MGKGHCPGATDGAGVRADVALCAYVEVLVGAAVIVVVAVEVEERSDVIVVDIDVDNVDDTSPLPGLGRPGMIGTITPGPSLFDMAMPTGESVCLGVAISSKGLTTRAVKVTK